MREHGFEEKGLRIDSSDICCFHDVYSVVHGDLYNPFFFPSGFDGRGMAQGDVVKLWNAI